jgi:hypothetical protein
LAADGAGWEGVIVVQDDFQALLLGLFQGDVVQTEILGTEERHKRRGTAGTDAAGLDEKAPVVELSHFLDAVHDVLFVQRVQRETPHGVSAVCGGGCFEDGRIECRLRAGGRSGEQKYG